MTHTILIGKNRRITLDELASLVRYEAHLEMMQDNPSGGDTNEGGGAKEDSGALASALEKLTLDTTAAATSYGGSPPPLSPEATIASLALLSLTYAQGRVIRGECAMQLSSSLVNIVNCVVANGEKEKALLLPSNSKEFASSVNSLMGEGLKIVEDGPYLKRVISLARVSLMLAQGTCCMGKHSYC